MSDDLDVQSSRVVVAVLDADAEPDAALRSARTASAEGSEVVYLARSDAQATAWAVRAEDAATALVVADEASAQQLREALDAMGLHEVQVSRVAPR